jgi:pseudaminic acid biosynthesis-associated methylase
MKETIQIEIWKGQFGKSYTERNTYSVEDNEKLYRRLYGTTRSQMNEEFLSGMDRSMPILEVGSNVGGQLLILQKMGFKNLFGIEIQEEAIEFSKTLLRGIYLIKGSAFDIPFKDGFFELVFTSGVLIHIAPADIRAAMREIHRCTNKYIWGFEYYSETYQEVEYRGRKNLLWKADFAKIYIENFNDLAIEKEKNFAYFENDNIDSMFLLKKS